MKSIDFTSVELQSGYWFSKEELNRKITINAVYEQFDASGRIGAFDCNWRDGQEKRPHIFWDSDVAKWMEGTAYILAQHADAELERRLDELIEKIRIHQGSDGYFNIYFITVEPAMRFHNRDSHELYCAGHLIEAAIACDAIGKPVLLECMKKYVDYIRRVFVEEKSALFATPGHEELEIALMRLYRYTGERSYLELAAHFINIRGTQDDYCSEQYASYSCAHSVHNQSHLPVREQREAVGHAVRAFYLYTGMAMLAKETDDAELFAVCRTLFENITRCKMYVTGGVGSSHIGEVFTNAFDLPNDIAYAETCAAISLMFFSRAMGENEVDGCYADVIERAFYNGVLSGLSLDGKRFFYTNPLEINRNEHFKNAFGEAWFPITQRPEIFGCSCCPPNLNRLLPTLGGYLFGREEDTLYIHQYATARMMENGVSCTMETDYPVSGSVRITVEGILKVAVRIPGWCSSFEVNKPYKMEKGYAVIQNDGTPIHLELDLTPHAVFADSRVARDAYKLCIMRGPVVYCAESVDNGPDLHAFSIATDFAWSERNVTECGLPEFDISAFRLADSGQLYSSVVPEETAATLHLIPYSAFANRGECDMRVWFYRHK